ncbi:MAG: tRNA 4-thiouridine(8) synthase ThiI [Clostridiales bacterium]|nr:MAG: tRNA 4-thiouridine(8) synthase ThiI [Clostridiales bacterium]
MTPMLLIRYGEIHLKGQNRPFFEKVLLHAIIASAKKFDGYVDKGQGRYYLRNVKPQDMPQAINAMSKIFGIYSVSPAMEMEKDLEIIFQAAADMACRKLKSLSKETATFKVESKRADKRFPMNSMTLSAEAGGYILEHVPGLSVDVHHPDFTVYIEVRESAFVYTDIVMGSGGMPVGTSGKGMLLLSGGIDSPVAGYMMAKRGIALEAVHYHSFPYTSERAKQKVIELAQELSAYTGPIKIHMVHFTDIQMSIYEKCPEEQLTLIMRVFMMRIAEKIAKDRNCGALITGESLGQVASQTLASLTVTNSVIDLPVFRPLIGMDKLEIMDIAKRIDTYETSILPYEDCCTVFVPKHPVTHPKLEKILKSVKLLDSEALIADALAKTEVITVTPACVE